MRSRRRRSSRTRDLLRIANLLLRDDETVNRAEHQRLAVEIALLKAATFPRLKSVESGSLAGGSASSVTAAPAQARVTTAARSAASRRTQPTADRALASGDLVDAHPEEAPAASAAISKDATRGARKATASSSTFDDAFHADSVTRRQGAIEQIASRAVRRARSIDARLKDAEPAAAGGRARGQAGAAARRSRRSAHSASTSAASS